MGATEIAKALKLGQPNGENSLRHSRGDQSAKASADYRPRGVGDLARKACRAFELSCACHRFTGPSQKPCRWDCERQRQGAGIHRRDTGNVL
jgi:hypothetical protein